ncbi:solute carrier family 2, facilitated glucose transporter member 8 [Folsomia candida]|uniref:Facilitated trehalose transporter Tret1 n=1 Tax=Folsomia candida TaxID=158441 RepID=A0A226CZA8_FOLCA|nr:solute carrier family 2, facilitated glucose transporter member 8 [Folsomia candida]OXA37954.1 Facilitated trehalose transporter Tret1 [Folsomia candida]
MKSYTVNHGGGGGGIVPGNSRIPQYLAAAAVTVGGFAMGSALGWSSPSLPNLKQSTDFYPLLDPTHLSWIGSILTIGAAVGALLSGGLVDLYGRKVTMLISSAFFLWGWISLGLARGINLLLIGRFLTGLAVGCLSLVAPLFLTEISQPQVRGVIGVAFQLMVVLGSLFSTVLGSLSGWRVLSWACSGVPVIFACGICILPESPRFLLRKGKVDQARSALNWLRNGDPDVTQEFEDLQESTLPSTPSLSLGAILSPRILRPIGVTISLVLFNQICGISAVNFYTVDIFAATEKGGDNVIADDAGALENSATTAGANLSAIIVQLVQVGAVFLSSLLVDRVGRRVLLLTSFAIMTSALLGLGASFVVHLNTPLLSWLPLASVIFYNVGYSIGIGSLVWTVMSELLPASVVGVVYALLTAYNWALAFLITKYFALLQESFSIQNTFWGFAGCCVLAGISIFFTVPETRGKTLEQIQDQCFNGKKNKSDLKSDLVC